MALQTLIDNDEDDVLSDVEGDHADDEGVMAVEGGARAQGSPAAAAARCAPQGSAEGATCGAREVFDGWDHV